MRHPLPLLTLLLACTPATSPPAASREQPLPQPPPVRAAGDGAPFDAAIELKWPPSCREPGPEPPSMSELHGLPICDGGT
jgi:hypothetical protein